MGEFYCGYQHRLMGEGFENVAHFKNCTIKHFLGLTDFSFLWVFIVWNLAENIPERPIRGGEKKIRDLKNWKFYSIALEEMMTYVDNK